MKNNEVLPVMIGGVRVSSNGDGLYSLNDLHKASGGERKNEPHLWLRSELALEAIRELEEETTRKCVVTKEGRGGGTYVDKILLGMYASWISSKFHILVYKVFFEAMEEKAAALENENKKLTEFKDDYYKKTLANNYLSNDYSKLNQDVAKGIRMIINEFKWRKKVLLSDVMFLPMISGKASKEALEYAKRNILMPIDDKLPPNKTEIFLR